ncbi:MAG: histidine phosphatase family protein [Planctomycetes bacterium]|nr:histidine phosphatase family protein [Planctomycetota bacterium]
MKLYLIRHGETKFNQQHRYCGITNPPLTTRGKKQVHQLVRRLKKIKIDLVYTSPLRRAIQTSQIIFKNKKTRQIPALREINFGLWEKLTYDEVTKKYPRRLNEWIQDPWQTSPNKGESLVRFQKRILSCLRKKIIPQYKKGIKNIALVSHGGVIKIIWLAFHKHDPKNFWSFHPKLGTYYLINLSRRKDLCSF